MTANSLDFYLKSIIFSKKIQKHNSVRKEQNLVLDLSGGEDVTRTRNALRHTTFPMWLLTN